MEHSAWFLSLAIGCSCPAVERASAPAAPPVSEAPTLAATEIPAPSASQSEAPPPAAPWRDPCEKLLTEATRELRGAVEPAVERWPSALRFSPGPALSITVEEGSVADDTELEWGEMPSNGIWSRARGTLHARLEGVADHRTVEFSTLRYAAESCLSLEPPRFDTQGILVEYGVTAAPWGSRVLFVGELAAGIFDNQSLQGVALPEDLPAAQLAREKVLDSFECGNGDRLLAMNDGVIYSPNHVWSPTSWWWRNHEGRFGERGEVRGRVIGCIADATLLVHMDGRSAQRFELVGEATRPLPKLSRHALCSQSLAGRAFVTTAKGDVFGDGAVCGSEEPAVEVWPRNSERSRVARMRDLPRASHAPSDELELACLSGSLLGLSRGSLMRFPPPVPGAHCLLVTRGIAVLLTRDSVLLRELDGSWSIAPRPKPNSPYLPRAIVGGGGMTADGTVLLSLGYSQSNCQGRCHDLYALLRIERAQFQPLSEKSRRN